jgi:hypothetical protein
MGKRWWLMQVIDAWNDVPAAPGSRTQGSKGGNFALVGPNFKGTLPIELTALRVDTSLAALVGRTYTAGAKDYAAVNRIQDQYRLVPLPQWKEAGAKYVPPASVPVKPGVDTKTPVPVQVFKMTAEQFFGRLAELLVDNPPRTADAPVMARLARLGVEPGSKFSIEAFDADTRKAIGEGIAAAQQQVREQESEMGEMVNGWQIALDMGRYGTKYTYRAGWTFFGVGGNLPEDAVYPVSDGPDLFRKFDGAKKYVMHFEKGLQPPVNGFWSLTMYDKDSYLVANCSTAMPWAIAAIASRRRRIPDDLPAGRLTRQGQGKQLAADAEGGSFKLALRLYVPKAQVADGTWEPPAVKRVS